MDKDTEKNALAAATKNNKKVTKAASKEADREQDEMTVTESEAVSHNALPSMEILAQSIKDLSFENPHSILYWTHSGFSPSTMVNVDVSAHRLDEQTSEVTLAIKVHMTQQRSEAGKVFDETVFLIEVVYTGILKLSSVPEEYEQFILFVEGPRTLFPFVRAIIARLTQESGFPPLLLKPIDFMDLLQRRLQQQSADPVHLEGNA